MKYLFLLLFIITFAACNNGEPETETTLVDTVIDANGEMTFARVITSASKWTVTLDNGDKLQVTYTPSSYTPATYTASKFDTVLFRKGTTPPVDPPPVEPPPTAGYTLVYTNGFDKDSDIRNDESQQAGKGVISRSNFKEGTGSFYSIPENVSSGIRSEVQFTNSTQNPTTGAIEYLVYYENPIASDGCSVQSHPFTSGSSGSPYLMHEGGKFTWVVWNKGGNTYYRTNISIEKGKWFRFRIEFKFGTASQGGFIRWFIDGKQVFEKLNIQVGDGSGGYWKIGWNSWSSAGYNSRIYYDGFSIFKKN